MQQLQKDINKKIFVRQVLKCNVSLCKVPSFVSKYKTQIHQDILQDTLISMRSIIATIFVSCILAKSE